MIPATQVLGALWELLRGFQAADEAAHGRVLYELPREDPQQIYGGLVTVIMRLVFLLYAEDQGLMPDDPDYSRNYAIGVLFERLREDAGRYPDTIPDTMDQRYGAYAWLLSTFRMVFDGGAHGGLSLPTRHGQLFDPDEYAFLEGRPPSVPRVVGETFEAPRVSDGVIWRVLCGLLVLNGERLSYRALDVEQVGSVYESMMGFDVNTLPGRALSVRPKGIVVDVDALLAVAGPKRAAWLKKQAECDLRGSAATALKEAATAEDVVVALGRKVAPETPRVLPPGALFLQPGEERRRSGSHYTPRELTEPIVRTTLAPILGALGPRPLPEQILSLKICDPAMGSGAFLVESCRQLASALVSAWEVSGAMPRLRGDEDPLLHARRLVAQRCLYGVDKNRFAVNLAKLSLWLVTLAKEHAFTFLDHALKHGDSLVGLMNAQIGSFHWSPPKNKYGPSFRGITEDVIVGALRGGERAVMPFHWEIEFPEVFGRPNAGFDAVVGNPPFRGGTRISTDFGGGYLDYLKRAFPGSGNRTDLVAYFFCRAFMLLRDQGAFGLVATNTIAQGDTRESGLVVLRRIGGTIIAATRRVRWPGTASVVVSLIWVLRGHYAGTCVLDGRVVKRISAYLFEVGPDESPMSLQENEGLGFCGPKIDGDGFIFDDNRADCSPISKMKQILAEEPGASNFVFPLLGGSEMLTAPVYRPLRYVIDFGDVSLEEAARHPRLLEVLERKAKPHRLAGRLKNYPWWQFERHGKRLRTALAPLQRSLMHPFTSTYLAFSFVPKGVIVPTPHCQFAMASFADFSALQSRPHEEWVRFVGSSMRDDLRYTPSDCFETFPFPPNWQTDPKLEAAGSTYYEERAALMVRNNEGLTKTYNRFHDPHEGSPEIRRLRELHAAMDRAVLDAYGWSDISTRCEFLLDYEIDEETWGDKKKPYRYRFPDEVRDEILARLLDLNQKRYEEGRMAGPGTPMQGKAKTTAKKKGGRRREG